MSLPPQTNAIARPDRSEYADSYREYVDAVPGEDAMVVLATQAGEIERRLALRSEADALHRYAPGKWSVKGVLGHLVDSERIYAYRTLRIARGDATPLPGYDENKWGAVSSAHGRTLVSLLDDFQALRSATLTLLRGFNAEEIGRSGVANNAPVTVRALAWIVAGHERHHVNILKERYLNS